jgi:hypothetical protein
MRYTVRSRQRWTVPRSSAQRGVLLQVAVLRLRVADDVFTASGSVA